jgi:glutathione-regulated potassium-efflux system ancillary protein KefC
VTPRGWTCCAAGAAQAKSGFNRGEDNVGRSLKIVDVSSCAFSQLQIVIRQDVPHWNALRDRGVMRDRARTVRHSLRSARACARTAGPASPYRTAGRRTLSPKRNLALFRANIARTATTTSSSSPLAKQGAAQLEAQMEAGARATGAGAGCANWK